MEQGDSSGPNFIEEESDSKGALKKPKKFPLAFGRRRGRGRRGRPYIPLVLKEKKYELTVTLGAGTTAPPATGMYKKGEVVAYSYSPGGYASLHCHARRCRT